MSKTNFKFGSKSLANLRGVHPDLVAIITLGLTKYCPHDFSVIEGLRTPEQAYINWGKGRTVQELATVNGAAKYAQPKAKKVTWLRHPLNSKHCVQRDGLGHAVDLLPVVGGWEASVEVFKAMDVAFKKAAVELGKPALRWGGDWDEDGKVGEKNEWDFVHWEI